MQWASRVGPSVEVTRDVDLRSKEAVGNGWRIGVGRNEFGWWGKVPVQHGDRGVTRRNKEKNASQLDESDHGL